MRKIRTILVLCAAVAIPACGGGGGGGSGAPGGALPIPTSTALVSLSSALAQADGNSSFPVLSSDGRYVAFQSAATNLVPGDTNGSFDVFLRDTLLGTTTRVSVSGGGTQGNNDSNDPAISWDGRHVAFHSAATGLVPGDTNGTIDVFVRDTVAGTTTRVSVTSAGGEANNASTFPSISSDGRYVAFRSSATNLVAGDTNGQLDVFVRDTLAGVTVRVSLTALGAQAGGGGSFAPSISADGRYVSFDSLATNLVGVDTNLMNDVFVRDLILGTTVRASVDSLGTQANDHCFRSSISADGRYVSFDSVATNLVAGDTNLASDVFVRDLLTGTTVRASLGSGGTQGSGDCTDASISADGRHVAFWCIGSDLVTGDTNGDPDIFVRDLVAGATSRVSVDSQGAQGNDASSGPCLSADGRHVAYSSQATNLVPGDTNARTDVFARGPL